MRSINYIFLLMTSSSILATEIPKEFLGDWVPQAASCQSELKFRVEPNRITLKNRETSRSYGDIDICYSCEGGAKYMGKVVWLMPEFHSDSPGPFTASFNVGEKLGVAKLDIYKLEEQKVFLPLHDVLLKRCKYKPSKIK